MNIKNIEKIFILWFMFIPIAIINGIIRNEFYESVIGSFWAHILSTIILSFLFLIFISVLYNKIEIFRRTNPLYLGFFWVILTVIFGFIFGHYVAGHDWRVLLQDYNLLAGRVWIVFLLVVFMGPTLIHKRQGQILKNKE